MRPVAASDWNACKSDFEWDGSLRDLYVQDATIEDWSRCLSWLRSTGWPIEYTRSGEASVLPVDPSALFQSYGHEVSVNAAGLVMNCHFFSPEEIEFDIDPQEVNSEARFGSLLAFMTGCGRAIGKTALLTCENLPNAVILRYLPEFDEIEYVPAV